MEPLRLSAKELMCLAAAMGNTEIFGIPDGFRGVSDKALDAEIMLVQQSLERKDVLQMDFDGNVSFNRKYLLLLETMLGCDRFLGVDKQLRSEQTSFLFYGFEDRIVEAILDNGEYTLNELSAADFSKRIMSLVVWNEHKDCSSDKAYIVPQKKLSEIKQLAIQDNSEKAFSALVESGCGADMAKLLSDAFALKTNFYSFAFADITAKHNAVKSVMFIDDPCGIVNILPIIVNDVNHVELTAVSQEQMAAELLAAAERFAGVKEG